MKCIYLSFNYLQSFKNMYRFFPQPSDGVIIITIKAQSVVNSSHPNHRSFVNRLFESIVALANTRGGRVYIKREGKKYGFNEQDLNTLRDFCRLDFFPSMTNFYDFIPNVDFGHEQIDYTYSYGVIYVQSYEHSLITYFPNGSTDGVIYVRDNGRNIKYDPKRPLLRPEKHIKYMLLQPSRSIHEYGKDYHFINVSSVLQTAYRYISLDSFIVSLTSGNWRFVEPKNWDDEYEGRFYNANYENISNSGIESVRKLYATCITKSPASEAAWKVYSRGHGLGSRCVQIKIDMEQLRKELCEKVVNTGITISGKKDQKGEIYEGTVYYDLTDTQIDNLDKSGSLFHDTFFDSFSKEKFLKLLLIKRVAYSYEDETRIFIVPNEGEIIEKNRAQGGHVDVPVTWNKIIQGIRIDSTCTKGELESIKFACEKANIKLRMPNEKGRKANNEIKLIKFNVDKMAGKHKITIEK